MKKIINKTYEYDLLSHKYFSEIPLVIIKLLMNSIWKLLQLDAKGAFNEFLNANSFFVGFWTTSIGIPYKSKFNTRLRPVSDLLIKKQYVRYWINIVLDLSVLLCLFILTIYYGQTCLLLVIWAMGIFIQTDAKSEYSDNKENIFALYRMKELKNKSKSIIEQKQSNKSYNKFDFHTSLTTEFYLILNSLINGQFNSVWKHVKLYIKKLFYIIPSAKYFDEMSVLKDVNTPEWVGYVHMVFGAIMLTGYMYLLTSNIQIAIYLSIVLITIRSYIPSHYLKMLYSN